MRFCNLCDADFAGNGNSRFCPDCARNRKRLTWNRFGPSYRPFGTRVRHESCIACSSEVPADRSSYCSDECRHRAWDFHKNHRRRSAYANTDLTPELEQALRRRTRVCRECGCHMVNRPYTPRSKELDHILSLHAGGTHTLDNVRIICRQCNQSRPKDARDLPIQMTIYIGDRLVAAS